MTLFALKNGGIKYYVRKMGLKPAPVGRGASEFARDWTKLKGELS